MIQTRSSFYYIDPVVDSNRLLNFREGAGPELTADVQQRGYTMSELAASVQTALNNAGALTYTVAFNRESRCFTISASGVFDLLTSTGTANGVDIFPLLGFTGADKTGGTSYQANECAGVQFLPQFWLQSYVDAEDYQESISPAVVKSASGIVEVVKFGDEKFFEFEIMFSTDIEQGKGSVVETNLQGVLDLRNFMKFCVRKLRLEFMPDRDSKPTFFKVLLESTPQSNNGTGFKLSEMYGQGLPGYFSSGMLRYRVVE